MSFHLGLTCMWAENVWNFFPKSGTWEVNKKIKIKSKIYKSRRKKIL